jgi:hypothetical protein
LPNQYADENHRICAWTTIGIVDRVNAIYYESWSPGCMKVSAYFPSSQGIISQDRENDQISIVKERLSDKSF